MYKGSEFKDRLTELFGEKPNKITISNPRNKSACEYKKIVIAKKIIKNNIAYQFEKFTEKQVFHENLALDSVLDRIVEYKSLYKQINIVFSNSDVEIKINKAGDFSINKSSNMTHMAPKKSEANTNLQTNNRKKNYILKEGMDIPVFKELGIFTNDLKVVNSKYDKFKQINRFTEIMDDILKDYKKSSINVIDFGCGKSYLTFVVYYYLTEVKGLKANIIGLDLKSDVILQCNLLSEKYNYSGLKFKIGDINGYEAPFDVDMVISLHACDTATDYALFNAIEWNADMIMSVPCCQHEVNKQIQSDELSGMIKYGIIKERTAALITDAIRGCMLECAGYKVDEMEFIDIEHSPKNILIRAKKTNVSKEKKKKSYEEAKRLADAFGLNQTLMSLLRDKIG